MARVAVPGRQSNPATEQPAMLTCEMVSGGTGVTGSGLLMIVTGAPWRSACTNTSSFLQAGSAVSVRLM
jgi:hypothetical protein